MPYGFYIDPLWLIIVGPALLLGIWAQLRVKLAYANYSRMPNSRGYTGAQAAQEMLRREGVLDVGIERVDGWLSDHYDPKAKVLRLSPGVHDGRSVAAVGIACHEAGHALQHAHGYAPLGLRTLLVPTASLGSWMSSLLFLIGFWFMSMTLIKVGVVFFGAVVLFQLVTLPVEFNASSRAKLALQSNLVLTQPQEIEGVDRVLDAAAMTYVAATLHALAQLLYFVLIVLSGSRSRD